MTQWLERLREAGAASTQPPWDDCHAMSDGFRGGMVSVGPNTGSDYRQAERADRHAERYGAVPMTPASPAPISDEDVARIEEKIATGKDVGMSGNFCLRVVARIRSDAEKIKWLVWAGIQAWLSPLLAALVIAARYSTDP